MKIIGWYRKRHGSQIREASVNAEGFGISWDKNESPQKRVIHLSAVTDPENLDDKEHLRIELSPSDAMNLAAQLIDCAKRAKET